MKCPNGVYMMKVNDITDAINKAYAGSGADKTAKSLFANGFRCGVQFASQHFKHVEKKLSKNLNLVLIVKGDVSGVRYLSVGIFSYAIGVIKYVIMESHFRGVT